MVGFKYPPPPCLNPAQIQTPQHVLRLGNGPMQIPPLFESTCRSHGLSRILKDHPAHGVNSEQRPRLFPRNFYLFVIFNTSPL